MFGIFFLPCPNIIWTGQTSLSIPFSIVHMTKLFSYSAAINKNVKMKSTYFYSCCILHSVAWFKRHNWLVQFTWQSEMSLTTTPETMSSQSAAMTEGNTCTTKIHLYSQYTIWHAWHLYLRCLALFPGPRLSFHCPHFSMLQGTTNWTRTWEQDYTIST